MGSSTHSSSSAALTSAVSGAISGSLVSAVLQPLDVIRTRLQTDAMSGSKRPLAQTLRAITSEGGGSASSLWRGTTATVLRVGGGAGVHFYSLQLLRELRARHREGDGVPKKDLRGSMMDAAMGGGSRAMAVLVMCPITTVKTRMEASGPAAANFAYKSVPHALRTIARDEGVAALWRGVGPALASNVPFSALHYVCYVQLRAALERRVGEGTATTFISGGAAAVLATLATQPFDVLRTRAMLSMGGPIAPLGLLAGIGPRLAKRPLQTALLWTLYEELWGRMKPAHGLRK